MIKFINDNFTWTLILVLLFNMSQRKIAHSDKKRISTIYIASLFLLFYIGNIVITILNASAYFLILDLAVCILIGFLLRKRVWPFRLHCAKCGKKLDYEHIIGHDDNLCQSCYDELHPEEAKAREEKKKTPQEKLQTSYESATKVSEIDWDRWEPTDRCVITYIQDNDKLLLIEKKQGLGTGYYNAPGGHIELEETANEAAIRETKEETGLDVADLQYRGTLYFNFQEGIREIGYVYFTSTYSGTLKECDEARPFWIDRDKIPYENMWEDDKLWLEGALTGRNFTAYFVFQDKKMLDYKVEFEDEE